MLVILALTLPAAPGFAQAAEASNDLAVVVNSRNLVSNMSEAELRRIFAGERLSWAGGVPIKLFTRTPGSPERACMLNLLHMTESEYHDYWNARQNLAAQEPVPLPSSGIQREAIQAFPGAIAIVEFRDVKSPMRVIRVDGRLPNERGYPLK